MGEHLLSRLPIHFDSGPIVALLTPLKAFPEESKELPIDGAAPDERLAKGGQYTMTRTPFHIPAHIAAVAA